MTLTLVRTKLNRPRSGRQLVHRTALLQILHQSLDGYLTLISAPAGYGKTTLAVDWAAQSPRPVAWLALDEHDNDLAVFLAYVVASIRTLFPAACPDVEALARTNRLPPTEVLSAILVNEIDDLPDRFVLVLDDYHYLTAPAIQDLLDNLLRHPPLQMHLIIIARADPPLALSRLRANGQMHELRARDLRFLPQEAEAFLALSVEPAAQEPVARALVPYAEGWIAGLKLALLSLRAAADPVAAAQALGQQHDRQIMDYLFEQVWQQQARPIRDFLTKTAIVDRLSPALARAIVAAEESDATAAVRLAALEQAGVFVSALDNTGSWYEYHALFKELLRRTLLASCPPAEVAQLHRRAAQWFHDNGLIDEGLQQALSIPDEDLAAHMVMARVTEQLDQEDWQPVARWLAQLPGEVVDRHVWLLIARAHVLQLQFRWDAYLPLLEQVEASLAAPAATRAPSERANLRGHVDTLWAIHWLMRRDAAAAELMAQRALENLSPTDRYAYGMVLMVLGVAQQWRGEFTAAEQVLSTALAQAPATVPATSLTWRPLFALMNLYAASGDFVRAQQFAQMLLQKSIEGRAPVSQAWARLALGALAYETHDLPQAALHFLAGVDLRYVSHTRAAQDCLSGLALTYQAQGRTDEARGVVAIMLDYQRELANPHLSAEAHSLLARLACLNGEVLNPLAWDENPAADQGLWFGWMEVPAITRIRISLAEPGGGPLPDRVWRETERLLASAQRIHTPRRIVELLALKAAVQERQGDRAGALTTLSAALTLGEQHGCVRSIADVGPIIEPLLTPLASLVTAPYLARLRSAFRPAARSAEEATRLPAAYLTRREREVLERLGQHQTDRDIAEALVISPLTVRSHIEHIAEKLGVHGRRAIVTRAREVGWLT